MKSVQKIERKRKVGKPAAFDSEGEFNKAINEYFEWAEDNEKPLTVSRLCVFIGVERHYLSSHIQEYPATIKKAIQIIEADKAERLCTARNPVGLIFDLKNNHGWLDESRIEHKLNGFLHLENEGKSIEDLQRESIGLAEKIIANRAGTPVPSQN